MAGKSRNIVFSIRMAAATPACGMPWSGCCLIGF